MSAVAKQFIVDTPTLYYGDIELSNPDTWAETLKGKELGLSKDGIKFSCKPTIRQIEYDGRMESKSKEWIGLRSGIYLQRVR